MQEGEEEVVLSASLRGFEGRRVHGMGNGVGRAGLRQVGSVLVRATGFGSPGVGTMKRELLVRSESLDRSVGRDRGV